ncbi:hypothetical protein [Vannielia sp.]|uniref:hypothetical protein n=1 Tax=Vannielia sp. TaxID=2813045 RepID=UPI00261E1390|nr:hypothetical protein [Vannielia sp.]MDF1873440.1 hypothetical protein [Vannielia sp.]
MDPGLILIAGFILAVVMYRAMSRGGAIWKNRTNTWVKPEADPEPPAPKAPPPEAANPATPRRASYGAARYRTRKRKE